ncbi:hypothetical protein [Methyloligella halotolerans]|nr:hypothetical protein [Methyloligella halotolerans]
MRIFRLVCRIAFFSFLTLYVVDGAINLLTESSGVPPEYGCGRYDFGHVRCTGFAGATLLAYVFGFIVAVPLIAFFFSYAILNGKVGLYATDATTWELLSAILIETWLVLAIAYPAVELVRGVRSAINR